MSFTDITVILGGLALFLHGMGLARTGLQGLAGDKLRSLLASMSRNRLVGLLSGAGATAIIQSSTATTSMLVSFAASGVIGLAGAIPLLLGADIGTTITVQLLSLRLSEQALLITFAGYAIRFIAKRRKARYLGDSLMGFGLLFFGLKLMSDGAAPLTGSPIFRDTILYFEGHPFPGLLAGAVLSVLLQGSAPAIGLVLSVSHGASLESALPLVLGANLGTTITPVLTAFKQEIEGRRVALAHLLFKVAGCLGMLPILPAFAHFVTSLGGDSARQIANAHTLFNVAVALAFLPFTGVAATAITRFYQPVPSDRFQPRYLDPRALDSPPLAFGLAIREFLRMADIVRDMLADAITVFQRSDLDRIEAIESRDDQVDILNREIRFYLAGLGQERMTPSQARRQMELITLTANIENAGDIINKDLMAMARKRATIGLQFSVEGLADLARFHAHVLENYDLALVAFSTNDEEMARKVMRHEANLTPLEAELKQRHVARLHEGRPESLDTSSIHLDVLFNLRRVNSLASNLAEAVISGRSEGHGVATA